MVLRVSEIYASTQGEGPNVGRTTVFLRFGGCNLRCPGWPCDTEHAINPLFRDEWKKLSVEDVFKETVKIAEMAGATLITLTGGEPFLQKNDDLRELVDLLRTNGYYIECFSNGTLPYPDWAIENITFIMDWKLTGSGEDHLSQIRLENIAKLRSHQALYPQSVKFVCKDQADFVLAHTLWSMYLKGGNLRTYYGRVWDGEITNAELVEQVMKHQLPWYLNVQMHNYIWPANERGR